MAFFNPYPVNAGPVASLIAKVATIPDQKCRLHRVIATNTNAATRYIQIFDAIALPADGAVPLLVFPLTSGQATQPPVDFGVYGRVFALGIVICNSSTEATKTIGAADSFFDLLVS